MTEVLVSLIVFAPMFLFVPVIGEYLDIKHRTIEASRYAAWERSVWSAQSGSWNNNIKTDKKIEIEVDRRFFGHPSQLLDTEQGALSHNNMVTNPLWSTVDTKMNVLKLKQLEDAEADKTYNPKDEAVLPVLNGIQTGSGVLRAFTQLQEKTIPVSSAVVDTVASEMNLNARDFTVATVSTPVKNHILHKDDMVISATSALLSNTWSAPDEDSFRDRVDQIVLNEPVDVLIKTITPLFVLSGGIGIGLYWPDVVNSKPAPVKAAVDSTVLPKHLLRGEAPPDEHDASDDPVNTQTDNTVTNNNQSLDSLLGSYNSYINKGKQFASQVNQNNSDAQTIEDSKQADINTAMREEQKAQNDFRRETTGENGQREIDANAIAEDVVGKIPGISEEQKERVQSSIAEGLGDNPGSSSQNNSDNNGMTPLSDVNIGSSDQDDKILREYDEFNSQGNYRVTGIIQ
jgi:hypothetical protein